MKFEIYYGVQYVGRITGNPLLATKTEGPALFARKAGAAAFRNELKEGGFSLGKVVRVRCEWEEGK